MTPARWARTKDLFDCAAQKPPAEREAFLDEACGSDALLRQEVWDLLLAAERETSIQSPVDWPRGETGAPALAADRILGRYRVEHELGAGGMGAVYRAFDTQLHRPVALKVLPREFRSAPERRERLLREARAASALNHPNIVGIFEVGSDAGMDFIAMELVEGQSLDRVIPARGLPLAKALDYAVQIAAGLAKAHSGGVIHRDLKPRNIMVTGDGLVKLLDFGLAKQMSATDVNLTAEGEILGTPPYMSPEQAQGRKTDTRSDIFSFGAVLYEMLTGRRAFPGASAMEAIALVLRGEPVPLAGVPPELDKLVCRCLRKDPARRCQHMDDVQLILEDLKAEAHLPAQPAPRPAGHRFGPVLAVVLAVLIGAAGIAWWWTARQTRVDAVRMRVVSLTTYPGVEADPTFSPDGAQVAFSWNGEKQDNPDIYIKMVGSGASPLRLTTDPAVDGYPAWSPDGRQIAFVRSREEEATVYLVSPLGGPERKLTDFRPPPLSSPSLSWSPDGKWLAIPDHDIEGRPGIFLAPAGQGEKQRLTSNPSDFDHSPAFSPDGRFLAYASCTDTYSCDVHILELGGGYVPVGQPRRKTNQSTVVRALTWSPDGQFIVYEASPDAGDSRYLWRLLPFEAAAPERMEVAGPQVYSPSIARAGRRLAYSRGGEDLDIWKFDSATGAKAFISSTLPEFNPASSPDGRQIVFASNRSGSTAIWLSRLDGSNLMQLTDGPGRFQGGPQWSPDGRSIAFSGQMDDGNLAVHIMDSAGGHVRRLTPPEVIGANAVSWSHDGKWLYYAANCGGRQEVFRVPMPGGPATQITDRGGFLAFESRDGKTLYYNKTRHRGITPVFARPLPSGPERLVIPTAVNDTFAVVENGIYYFDRGPNRTFALEFLDFASGKTRTVTTIDATPAWRLAVSPDQKTILFGAGKPAESDLMLIEDFR